jgi:hypothetical protein
VDHPGAGEWTHPRFEGSPWKPLSNFPEFADALRTAAPPPLAPGTYGAVPAQRPNRLAVAGLTLSILGMCCMPFSIVGLGLSIAGFLQIQKAPNAYTTTKAIAIAGMIVGALGIVLHLAAIQTDAFQQMMREMQRR